MRMKVLLCWLIAAALCTQLHAQTFPDKQKHFGKAQDFDRIDLRRTADGGFVTCTVMFARFDDNNDYEITKFDSTGKKQKSLTIGGSGNDASFSITPTQDHGYLVAGLSESGISGDKTAPQLGQRDFWIVKLDSLGHKQWDKTYGTPYDETGMVYVDTTMDGNYMFGGTAYGGMYVAKLNTMGSIVWDKTLINGVEPNLEKVIHTSDGGFIVAGNTFSRYASPSQYKEDYFVVKLDADGNTTWSKLYGSSSDDNLFDVIETPDGGFLTSGQTDGGVSADKTEPGRGLLDYWLVKTDANGNKEWDKTLGGNDVDDLPHVDNARDGGYIVSGLSWSGVSGDKTEAGKGLDDYWVVKLNKNGQVRWDKAFGGSGFDEASKVLEYKKNEYIVGGISTSSISGDRTVPNVSGYYDFWMVGFKYVPEINSIIADNRLSVKSITPVAENQFKVYPNPVKNVINIQAKGNNTYSLINANGKTVLTKTLNGNGTINIVQLPAGAYYLQNITKHTSVKVIITH